MPDLRPMLLTPTQNIREAMIHLGKASQRIVLITDEQGHLLWTVTDGDIRRAILDGITLDEPISRLWEYKAPRYRHPVTAPLGTSHEKLQALMLEHDVQQIPLVDEQQRVVDCVLLEDLLPQQLPLGVKAVVMAGGFGKRLAPLTENLPKPMLPVGGRPLLEHIVSRFQQAGIHQVSITTHYQAEKIIDHFGDGSNFGVNINYVAEEIPLGTAGALGLMDTPSETLLVVNGDILTGVDFRAMLDFHHERHACLTIGVRQYQFNVPYGVVVSENGLVQGLQEKPLYSFLVNAGIYLIEPAMLAYIPPQQRFDMTDLIAKLLDQDLAVASFPIIEYWLDIGQHLDYEQAQQDFESGKLT